MYNMATMLGAVASNPMVQQVGKNVLGRASDKVNQGVLGGIGGLIGGRKGKKIGKKIARGMSKLRKSIFGFEAGGKVRRIPMQVQGYNAGGVILKPTVMSGMRSAVINVKPLKGPKPRLPRLRK